MAYKDLEKKKANDRKKAIKYYYKNLEVERARNRERKNIERDKRRDEINERQRKWYAANKNSEARKQNCRRIKRDPSRGLRTAILNCERGALTVHELAQLVGERVAFSNASNGSTSRFGSRRG